tara:strand:+ start:340 stop:504 length:165 start_codon:yes stop_codon:yes gene_type:complete
MICCACHTSLIWQSDFDFEDYGRFDCVGIVGVYECVNEGCDIQTITIESPVDDI